jgi:hypothetical protein
LSGFKETNFLDRFSKNSQLSNFYENPSAGSRVVPCGRTDGQYDEANSRFSQFRTRPKSDCLFGQLSEKLDASVPQNKPFQITIALFIKPL